MNAKIKSLVLSVMKTNILLTVIATLAISLFNLKLGVAFLVGSIVATINFTVNAIVIHKVIKKRRGALKIQLSFVLRMLMILAFTLVFMRSVEELAFYLVGFIAHQISIFIYTRKNKALSNVK
ncbi:ATP synthase subunit I [Clostridium sp.]|uniref:ATP synthase subunit I n=1 Tax=Clostridium sp. TaxID=1506 RepID=UPI00260818A2|nr:ATP synthase subunit I [Clostridium sp.]